MTKDVEDIGIDEIKRAKCPDCSKHGHEINVVVYGVSIFYESLDIVFWHCPMCGLIMSKEDLARNRERFTKEEAIIVLKKYGKREGNISKRRIELAWFAVSDLIKQINDDQPELIMEAIEGRLFSHKWMDKIFIHRDKFPDFKDVENEY